MPQGSEITPQKSAITQRWRRRDRRYRRERDPMLNSVLNGDWSKSVNRRQIPEGTAGIGNNAKMVGDNYAEIGDIGVKVILC